jgi:hypothetical protein
MADKPKGDSKTNVSSMKKPVTGKATTVKPSSKPKMGC